MAVGLSADVTILVRSLRRLAYLDDIFKGTVKRYSTFEALAEEADQADVIVGMFDPGQPQRQKAIRAIC
ncbi:MAG: hypothetical protein R3C42_09555 [Parvularculaceae bacterium]